MRRDPLPMSAPIVWHDDGTPPPTRTLCTDCGISRSAQPSRCASACQFIRPDFPGLEARVHGRTRDPARPDELHFGVHQRMLQAQLAEPRAGAQWSGLTTRVAERLLESGTVQAVLTMGRDAADRWKPVPRLVTDPAGLAECRGMKMGHAPLLALLEPARAQGITRLAVIGLPCQVHALRALQDELGFEDLWVIGTPCSDNTSTANYHRFLALLDPHPETIGYCEFRADYRVELRHDDGRRRTIPFLQLPLSQLPADFFPLTCKTCVDYPNALADLTVGYMGGSGRQWLVVRNERGQAMLDLLGDELVAEPPSSAGRREGAVRGFLGNLQRAAGGLPLRRMPAWLRPLVAWLMPRVGPRGLEFARARIEMKALETVVTLQRERPRRMRHMVPDHVRQLAARYGVGPAPTPSSNATVAPGDAERGPGASAATKPTPAASATVRLT